jgi:hypothetical protein
VGVAPPSDRGVSQSGCYSGMSGFLSEGPFSLRPED